MKDGAIRALIIIIVVLVLGGLAYWKMSVSLSQIRRADERRTQIGDELMPQGASLEYILHSGQRGGFIQVPDKDDFSLEELVFVVPGTFDEVTHEKRKALAYAHSSALYFFGGNYTVTSREVDPSADLPAYLKFTFTFVPS